MESLPQEIEDIPSYTCVTQDDNIMENGDVSKFVNRSTAQIFLLFLCMNLHIRNIL